MDSVWESFSTPSAVPPSPITCAQPMWHQKGSCQAPAIPQTQIQAADELHAIATEIAATSGLIDSMRHEIWSLAAGQKLRACLASHSSVDGLACSASADSASGDRSPIPLEPSSSSTLRMLDVTYLSHTKSLLDFDSGRLLHRNAGGALSQLPPIEEYGASGR